LLGFPLFLGQARPGRIATQIGPIVAANEDAAAVLLDAVLGCISGPVFFWISSTDGIF
jgi:GNAT acetyltransferase-like protein